MLIMDLFHHYDHVGCKRAIVKSSAFCDILMEGVEG
jgi:hypothetical protein